MIYPLVIVLGIATYEEYSDVWKMGLPLSTLGVAVSAYHTAIQLSPESTCTAGGGCTSIYWHALGLFTIPRLSLMAFSLVTIGLFGVAWLDRT